MLCNNMWSRKRCRPPIGWDDDIYICRIVPAPTKIVLYFYTEGASDCIAFFRKKDTNDAWSTLPALSGSAVLEPLEPDCEYEFYIRSPLARSAVGYARTGWIPGTVVNYLHPEDPKYAFSGQHLCTPSLLRHPDGYLLASMDVFGRHTPQNLTLILRSDDDGKNWYHLTELFPCFWGKLFLHQGEVYMLATSTEYGDLLIGKSTDGGTTWKNPTVLLRGSCHSQSAGWHKSAMPVILHRGRLWTGIDYGSWASGGHANSLLSAPADSDLLCPGSWCLTEPLSYQPMWRGSVAGDPRGFLEGNAVVLPDGEIGNLLRYSTDRGIPNHGRIPILRGDCNAPERKLTFDHYVTFPGNLSKFDILFDDVSRQYYSIVNRIFDDGHPGARNLLSLLCSHDLEHWEVVADLLDYSGEDFRTVAFQYVSFLFDGDDLLYLSRTAFNGAKSYHDNNYITFHRVSGFRNINRGTQNEKY